MIENERKFLLEGRLPDGPRATIEQGYVLRGRVQVRVRSHSREGASLDLKVGRGQRRLEIQVPAPGPIIRWLLRLGSPPIRKERLLYGPWEIDRFIHPAAPDGVVLAEIEDPPEPGADLPKLPDGLVVLREVTADSRYRNDSIDRRGFPAPGPGT